MKLILASASPRRKELLEKRGYKFIISPADIDESFLPNLSIIENALRVAELKASAVLEQYPCDLVLACDTIVVYNDLVYGKPKDEQDAYNMLKTFSGKRHYVISSVSIMSNDKKHTFYEKSDVIFKELSDEDIYAYIKTGEPFGKAGSYAIQGIGGNLVLKHEGDLENIIGLPVDKIIPYLNEYELQD